MDATKYGSIVRWLLCTVSALGWFTLTGCGVSQYETALNESIENRKEEIRLIEELKRKAAENPDSGPPVDYSNMSKQELLEHLQDYLDRSKEALKEETGEEVPPPDALDAKQFLGE